MALQFADAACEQLAAFLEAGLPGALANVETAQSLTAGSLGRPSVVIRGCDPRDPRDNKVEVTVLDSGPDSLIDRSLFDYPCEVAITLFSTDAQVAPVQLRLLRWETAFWNLMGKGGSNLGGTVVAAMTSKLSKGTTRTPAGGQIAVGLATVTVRRQET